MRKSGKRCDGENQGELRASVWPSFAERARRGGRRRNEWRMEDRKGFAIANSCCYMRVLGVKFEQLTPASATEDKDICSRHHTSWPYDHIYLSRKVKMIIHFLANLEPKREIVRSSRAVTPTNACHRNRQDSHVANVWLRIYSTSVWKALFFLMFLCCNPQNKNVECHQKPNTILNFEPWLESESLIPLPYWRIKVNLTRLTCSNPNVHIQFLRSAPVPKGSTKEVGNFTFSKMSTVRSCSQLVSHKQFGILRSCLRCVNHFHHSHLNLHHHWNELNREHFHIWLRLSIHPLWENFGPSPFHEILPAHRPLSGRFDRWSYESLQFGTHGRRRSVSDSTGFEKFHKN
jgi:hypothetical protein